MNQDLELVKNLVQPAQYQSLSAIAEELYDTFNKKQIFRTDTEARISVLNDGNFPTVASKYWQAVREQNAMLENLIAMSFDYRRNEVIIREKQSQLSQTVDPFTREKIQIDIDESMYQRKNMELVAQDRVREILMWSQIKEELNDGSFDDKNVNTHQMLSLQQALENRAQTLTPLSGEAEVMNVLGPLNTVNRLLGQPQLTESPEKHLPIK